MILTQWSAKFFLEERLEQCLSCRYARFNPISGTICTKLGKRDLSKLCESYASKS